MGFSPNRLGSGYNDSRYRHIAVDSIITVPSSSSRAGILEFGAIALYSGVLCSPDIKSILIITISDMFFSAINILTFLGLFAISLLYNFMPFYLQLFYYSKPCCKKFSIMMNSLLLILGCFFLLSSSL